MNLGNVDRLIAKLETLEPDQFDMGSWFSKRGKPWVSRDFWHSFKLGRRICGTEDIAACIGGWTNIVRGEARWRNGWSEARWLGLTIDEGERLFRPICFSSDRRYTLDLALAVLRHMRAIYVETGRIEIDWGVVPLPRSLTRYLHDPHPHVLELEPV